MSFRIGQWKVNFIKICFVLVARRDSGVARNASRDALVRLGRAAVLYDRARRRSVRVRRLGVDVAALRRRDVADAARHLATHVARVMARVGAVDELLLREGIERARLVVVRALHRRDRQERPAATALALVRNRRHSVAHRAPVE